MKKQIDISYLTTFAALFYFLIICGIYKSDLFENPFRGSILVLIGIGIAILSTGKKQNA